MAELFNEQYAVCYNFSQSSAAPDQDLVVNLFCIDPSRQLQERLQKVRSAVFFSATLTPMDYFREIFGCNTETQELILSSPFPRNNFSLIIANSISNCDIKAKGKVEVTGGKGKGYLGMVRCLLWVPHVFP